MNVTCKYNDTVTEFCTSDGSTAHTTANIIRVRTILVLGYWVLGNIHRYWIVLLLGGIFCCSDTQYNTDQTTVGTIHLPVNDYLVPLVTCTLTAAIVCMDTMLISYCLLNTIIVIIIEFWDFSCSLLYYTLVSVLVLGIGIATGQYYRILDIGCLSWYRSNPKHHNNNNRMASGRTSNRDSTPLPLHPNT